MRTLIFTAQIHNRRLRVTAPVAIAGRKVLRFTTMIANVCHLSNTGGNLGSEAIAGAGAMADHLSYWRNPERVVHLPDWVVMLLLAV